MTRATRRLLLPLVLLAAAIGHASAGTYLYRQDDGTLLHTDIPPAQIDSDSVTLLRVIREAKSHRKQNSFVRRQYDTDKNVKPVFSHCTGVQSDAMQARANAYADTVAALAREHRVSKHLVMAVIAAESCFDRFAVSKAGAAGLMQLMPATARSLGVEDPFNHIQNLRGGIRYLSKLSEQFDDQKLVLAAYNAGPGNVRKYNGIPPFPETRQYVTRVMANYLHYLQKQGQ